jgi:hypothetical protein
MRNIPLAFLDEETLDQIASQKAAKASEINGFEKLAEAQVAMRGMHNAPALWTNLKSAAKWSVTQLEKLMEMDGPNSIVNLERALRARNYDRKAN